MRVAPPPARRRSPDHLSGQAPCGDPHDTDAGHHAVDDALSWDHFAVEVTDVRLPVVVQCRGGLDFAYADQLRDVFAGITERAVVLDLARLTFVDSTGLSVMLSARRTLQDVGGTMSIRGASGLVRRIFEAAELVDVLDD